MAVFSIISKLPPLRFTQTRAFIDAKVKWVRDPYLDFAVQREKDLKQAISLKNQILSSPSNSLPLSSASLLKAQLNLPTSTAKFCHNYSSIFSIFQPRPGLSPLVKITPEALVLHREESEVHSSRPHRDDAVQRLAKLLMLAGCGRLPVQLIERLKWDLGLPHNYFLNLLADYPEYFQVCSMKDGSTGEETLALELVSWKKELSESELERRAEMECEERVCKRRRIAFPISFPKGFDMKKTVKNWVEEWQTLPYISPYTNAFHLHSNSDQAEKWTVAVLHELLWILISKKTERENVLCVGEYLGFGSARFRKALVHHPGIFYVSNKIRTKTVVLREAYKKDMLVEKHPSMGMRHRYIYLMNKVVERRKPAAASGQRG